MKMDEEIVSLHENIVNEKDKTIEILTDRIILLENLLKDIEHIFHKGYQLSYSQEKSNIG
jgi:hypothetical protein